MEDRDIEIEKLKEELRNKDEIIEVKNRLIYKLIDQQQNNINKLGEVNIATAKCNTDIVESYNNKEKCIWSVIIISVLISLTAMIIIFYIF